MQVLGSLAAEFGFELETPWKDLPEEIHEIILNGTQGRPVTLRFVDGRKSYEVRKPFDGVIGNLNRRMLQTEIRLDARGAQQIPKRRPLRDLPRAPASAPSRSRSRSPASISARPPPARVRHALAWFSTLEEKLNPTQKEIARAILKEINERLGFLNNVGLDYLDLNRTSGTLSGGESQRIRLASQIGSGLSGVLYVLDEPSIGLHQRDNERLLVTLNRLRDLGNTVLVVEHDEDAIRHADYVIDMGPGAGVHGGHIVAHGKLDDVLACEDQPHRRLSHRPPRRPDPGHAPQGHRQEAHPHRRHRQQPQERHRRDPARHLQLRHRRLRLGQVELHHRHALRRRRPPSSTAPASPPAATKSSPASNISTR